MRWRVLIYLVIIAVTFCAVLYLRNPELLKEVWLWIIGLFGIVAAYFETLWKSLKANLFPAAAPAKNSTKITTDLKPSAPALVSITAKSPIESVKIPATPIENKLSEQIALLEKKIVDQDKYIDTLESKAAQVEKTKRLQEVTFTGTTLTLLRFIDDGETTLGLLYLDGNFLCYTLEDTFRKEKVSGKTRIPAGTYAILFNKNLTELTQKYRARSYTKGWFTWHLHLQDVPGFQGIYIHPGKNTEWTEGCILVSDDLHSEGGRKKLLNPEGAFERLYKKLASDLDSEVPVRIRVQDELWFKNEIQNPFI